MSTILADKSSAQVYENVHEHAHPAMRQDRTNVSENDESAWQCMKNNPMVVLWTLYANIGAIMIGYDNLTLAVCLSMPAFQSVFRCCFVAAGLG
jgi:hypothetical protein